VAIAILPILILFLFITGVVLVMIAVRRQRQTGLPPARVIYDDSGSRREANKPFYDSFFGITGKPDYLLDIDGVQVPVEVKSTAAPAQPYPGHRLQLAVYCLLVERTTGKRPPYGILHYRDRTFAIDYTPELETELVNLLAEMRQTERDYRPSGRRGIEGAPRSHQSPQRCRSCGYRQMCDQKLEEA